MSERARASKRVREKERERARESERASERERETLEIATRNSKKKREGEKSCRFSFRVLRMKYLRE